MNTTIGLDIGSSATKIVGLGPGGEILGLRKIENDHNRSARFIVQRFAESHNVGLADVGNISLTGVGAPRIHGDIANIPTRRTNEFAAIARGGLSLARRSRALVVSMGTGTALIKAEGDRQTHLGGSGVGGGTIMGLSRHLFGLKTFEEIVDASAGGSLFHVDLKVGDIVDNAYINLPPELTSSNFGKISPAASQADILAGLVNMVLETVGVMAVLACRGHDLPCAVIIGSMTRLPQMAGFFASFQERMGVEFIIPEHAVYATALGAARLGG